MPVIEIDDLDDRRFHQYFTSITDSAWRLETLPVYRVKYEEEAFMRFLDGDTTLIHDRPSAWIDEVIAPAVERGCDIGRVHVIERITDEDGKLQLGDYLRFEFEWYKRNKAAGDDIRIAWCEPGKWPADVWMRGNDFWLLDEHTDRPVLIEMHYTPDGAFRKAVAGDHPEHIERAVRCKKAALAASKPFYP